MQSQVDVQVGEHLATGATGFPAQSQVVVQVGEHLAAAAIGLPAQSHVAVQVGEHLAAAAAAIGLPAQSHVAVQVGEHLAAAAPAIARPEQSQVEVQVGEQRAPAAFSVVGVVAAATRGFFTAGVVTTGGVGVATVGATGAAVSTGGSGTFTALAPLSSDAMAFSMAFCAMSQPPRAANPASEPSKPMMRRVTCMGGIPRNERTRRTLSSVRDYHSRVSFRPTFVAAPLNEGTCSARNRSSRQLPRGVPAMAVVTSPAPRSNMASTTLPSVANTTMKWTGPRGPAASLHAEPSMLPSAICAALRSIPSPPTFDGICC